MRHHKVVPGRKPRGRSAQDSVDQTIGWFARFAQSELGANLLETAMTILLIAVVAIGAITYFGRGTGDLWDQVPASFDGSTSSDSSGDGGSGGGGSGGGGGGQVTSTTAAP